MKIKLMLNLCIIEASNHLVGINLFHLNGGEELLVHVALLRNKKVDAKVRGV